MTEQDQGPGPERKSFLRRLFSQAEPAPSKPVPIDPNWQAQADVVVHGRDSVTPKAVADDAVSKAVATAVSASEAPPVVSPVASVQTNAIEPAAEPAPIDQAGELGGSPLVVLPDAAVPVAHETPASAVADQPTMKRSWWLRLRDGLSRSSSSIGTGLSEIFTKRKLDTSMLEELEDVLIRADLGVAMATRISDAVAKGRYDRDVSPDDVKAILATEVERVLAPCARPLDIGGKGPFVLLVVGVNGSGKTTTIGKLAAKFSGEGKSVMLAAGDTFRAAAIAQLTIWGERLNCPVIARGQGSDAAGLAFDAVTAAREAGTDLLLMDTAGRLQNRAELMAELEKIIRVMRKVDASAPHGVLLVLDATVGQNALSQVEIFGKVAGVTGLVMTKLDGTARGGILVAIAEKFGLPIQFIGVGETADDLEPFDAGDFAAAIAGVDRRTMREAA